MARTPWYFDNYAWPINPSEDSEWSKEHVVSEHNPVGSNKSNFQFAAERSARRQISGTIWGVLGPELMGRLKLWREGRKTAVLRDHMGYERSCFLINVTFKPIMDASERRAGRQTYTYTAEFVEA